MSKRIRETSTGDSIEGFVRAQKSFSEEVFGPGKRTLGICRHIASELEEIQAEPESLEEWCDVIILALDGAWRAGYTPREIRDALLAKQRKNMARQWPAAMSEDEPVFHRRGRRES